MKSFLFRLGLVLAVLMIAAAILPASADTEDYTQPDPVSINYPWWELYPPVVTRTRVVVRQAETMIESMPAEGWCYTAIKQVNVRSQPSVHATRVMRIKSAGTEFTVTARVKNSAGEIWYAVQLANGTLGYIRSDLLNTDHVILLGDPYAYEEEEDTKAVAASESASDVLNIVKSQGAQQPEVTPQVIYITPEPTPMPTPTPVYATPAPASQGNAF